MNKLLIILYELIMNWINERICLGNVFSVEKYNLFI